MINQIIRKLVSTVIFFAIDHQNLFLFYSYSIINEDCKIIIFRFDTNYKLLLKK